jgi:hypothetical protein
VLDRLALSALPSQVSELTREAIEPLLEAPRGRRRLLAAGAGASGHHDISEELVATEVEPSR